MGGGHNWEAGSSRIQSAFNVHIVTVCVYKYPQQTGCPCLCVHTWLSRDGWMDDWGRGKLKNTHFPSCRLAARHMYKYVSERASTEQIYCNYTPYTNFERAKQVKRDWDLASTAERKREGGRSMDSRYEEKYIVCASLREMCMCVFVGVSVSLYACVCVFVCLWVWMCVYVCECVCTQCIYIENTLHKLANLALNSV